MQFGYDACMTEVIILGGVSGSGKSTYAQRHYADRVVCGADDYFRQPDGSYAFDPTKLDTAHAECYRKFIEAIRTGQPVVIDNTNTTVSEISPYVIASRAYGMRHRIIQVWVNPGDLAKAAARNKSGVPLGGIERQYQRLCQLQMQPRWEHIRVPATW